MTNNKIQAAVALCENIEANCASDYSYALREMEPEFWARHALTVAVWSEFYGRRTPCWLYFATVNDGDLVKVGRSTKVVSRLATLDRQHGVKHDLLGTVRGDYREEGFLHSRFRKHRVKIPKHREYYRYEPIAEIINDIIVAGVPLHPAPVGYFR